MQIHHKIKNNFIKDKSFIKKDSMSLSKYILHKNLKSSMPIFVDASSHIVGGALKQYDENGVLHPVAYHLRNLCNYVLCNFNSTY